MSAGRNSRPAPEIGPRCATCGSTRLDGNGPVTTVRGIDQCRSCADGAAALVAEDPHTWGYGPSGHLRRLTPNPAAEARKARVLTLAAQVTAALADPPTWTDNPRAAEIVVEVFNEQSGVAVILPFGYRWHFTIDTVEHMYVARLFSAERELVPAMPEVMVDATHGVRSLVAASLAREGVVAELIRVDAARRLEIMVIDSDELAARLLGHDDME